MPLRLLLAAALAVGLSSAAGAQSLASGKVNTGTPTFSNDQNVPLQLDASGALKVTGGGGGGGGSSSPVVGTAEQDVRSSGTLNAATQDAAVTIPINGQSTVGLRFSGLTASGATLTYEQSNDGGATYTGVNEVNAGTGVPAATRNTDGQTRVAVQARTNLRIRVSTTGTGTISIVWNVSVREGLMTLASPLPPGINAIGSVLSDLRVAGAAVASGNPVPVSATSWPLPSGAATAAKQPAFGTAGSASADVLSVQGIAGGTPQPVAGNVAAGTADSGNPVKIGGVYMTTSPTLASGQRGDLQLGMYGQVMTSLMDTTSNVPVRAATAGSDGQSSGTVALWTNARSYLYNGTSFDRTYTGPAASGGTGTGTTATVLAPVSGAVGIVPVVTTTSGVVGKASAGNLYGFGGTMGSSTGGFFALLNATAVPATGSAITPVECVPVAANASYRSRQDIPDRYSTGIVLLSTSSCTTYTAVAPAVMQVVSQ